MGFKSSGKHLRVLCAPKQVKPYSAWTCAGVFGTGTAYTGGTGRKIWLVLRSATVEQGIIISSFDFSK
ncbi:TPA: hypothetical protein DEP58_00020 [Patescibacteria group bacterium]|nr:hypothetical protein [Patescibacteria group bacterium]